jgi:hypothetical protein
MAANKIFLVATREMGHKGMVTAAVLADAWGSTYNNVKWHARAGNIPKGQKYPGCRVLFFPANTAMPYEMPRRPKLRKAKIKAVVRWGPWASWKAPGFTNMKRRRYQVLGKTSYGWFGAAG